MKFQILLSIAVRFLIYFVHWMVLAYLPLLLKSYGISDMEIGIAIGVYSLSSMVLMLPMGAFSDFFSPKRTILTGSLFLAAYIAGLLLARSFFWIVVVILIGGLGIASLVVVTESLYLKLFGREKRGIRVAFYQMSTYLGFGLGPLVGGFLINSGPAQLFTVALCGAGLIFLLGLFLADFEPLDFAIREYRSDILQFKPLLLIACIMVLGTHFGVEQTSFSLLMQEKLDFSSQKIGFIFAGIGLWMAAIVPFIGWLHDRREDVFLFFLGGLAVSGFFQVITAWAFDFKSLLAIRLLHTLGDAVAMLELSVLLAVFFPAHRLGGNSGLLYALRTLAIFLAALLSGAINLHFGYGASFLANGAFVLCFVIATVLFIACGHKRREAVGWERRHPQ